MGGKMLLNIAPREDGTFQEESLHILEELGAWNRIHREAIWGTGEGISRYHTPHPTTISEDGRTLYVFLFGRQDLVLIKGLHTEVARASVLGREGDLSVYRRGGATWARAPLMLWVAVPEDPEIGLGRVLKLELTDPISTYGGSVGVVTQN